MIFCLASTDSPNRRYGVVNLVVQCLLLSVMVSLPVKIFIFFLSFLYFLAWICCHHWGCKIFFGFVIVFVVE